MTAQSAEPAQGVIAPSRAVEGIAERFPTTAGFVTALLASIPGATNDAPENPVVAVNDAIHLTRGTSTMVETAAGPDMRFAVSLLLAVCTLLALVFWGWFRGRTQGAMR